MSKELIERIDAWFERHRWTLEFADKQLYLDCRDELTKQAATISDLEESESTSRYAIDMLSEEVKRRDDELTKQAEWKCPCELADKPCDDYCPCVQPHSSSICHCCANVGSDEQRKAHANSLVKQAERVKALEGLLERWKAIHAANDNEDFEPAFPVSQVVRELAAVLKEGE